MKKVHAFLIYAAIQDIGVITISKKFGYQIVNQDLILFFNSVNSSVGRDILIYTQSA